MEAATGALHGIAQVAHGHLADFQGVAQKQFAGATVALHNNLSGLHQGAKSLPDRLKMANPKSQFPCIMCCMQDGHEEYESIIKSMSDLPVNTAGLEVQDTGGGILRNLGQPKEVKVTRKGSHWRTVGLVLAPSTETQYLEVKEVLKPSIISAYNDKQASDWLRVRRGDKIKSINGANTVDTMVRALQGSTKGSELTFEII